MLHRRGRAVQLACHLACSLLCACFWSVSTARPPPDVVSVLHSGAIRLPADVPASPRPGRSAERSEAAGALLEEQALADEGEGEGRESGAEPRAKEAYGRGVESLAKPASLAERGLLSNASSAEADEQEVRRHFRDLLGRPDCPGCPRADALLQTEDEEQLEMEALAPPSAVAYGDGAGTQDSDSDYDQSDQDQGKSRKSRARVEGADRRAQRRKLIEESAALKRKQVSKSDSDHQGKEASRRQAWLDKRATRENTLGVPKSRGWRRSHSSGNTGENGETEMTVQDPLRDLHNGLRKWNSMDLEDDNYRPETDDIRDWQEKEDGKELYFRLGKGDTEDLGVTAEEVSNLLACRVTGITFGGAVWRHNRVLEEDPSKQATMIRIGDLITGVGFVKGDARRIHQEIMSTKARTEVVVYIMHAGPQATGNADDERGSLSLPTLQMFDVIVEKTEPGSHLGVELEDDPLSEGMTVMEILRDGSIPAYNKNPGLNSKKVREGDVILAVNGHSSSILRNFDLALAGQVKLTIMSRQEAQESPARNLEVLETLAIEYRVTTQQILEASQTSPDFIAGLSRERALDALLNRLTEDEAQARLEAIASGTSQAETADDVVFKCPSECQECCVDPQSPKDRFRCILKTPHHRSGLSRHRSCTQPGTRRSANVEVSYCIYTPTEKLGKVWEKPSLKNGCSERMRCCCSARGDRFCVGDKTTTKRLMDAYGVSEAYLLDSQPEGVTSEHIVFSTKKKRKYRGMCPKGFSDYDIEGELCKCEESACEHLERVPPAPPRGKSDALMEVQMASVSTGIYMAGSPVSGWSLKVLWDQHWDHSQLIDPDISGIYVKMFPTSVKPTCVLVFSGTSSLKEVAEDLNIKETTYCDGQFKRVHKGFVDKANTFMGPTWDKMMNYLLDQEKCGGGVIFAGHSLGGAAADLFAACFNLKRKHSAELPSHLQGVRELYPIVDSVWTIGAPAITKDKPLSNALAEDGCFEGGRWYNQDHDGSGELRGYSYDPVPILAKHVGFLHPRMTAVAVYKDPHITQFRKRYCDGQDLEGNTKKLQAPDLVPAAQVRSLLSRPLKSFLLHKKDPYITRMMAAAESPDLTHAVEFPNLP